MRRILGIVWCVLMLGLMAAATGNMAGSQEVGQVAFAAPVRVGTALLQPGIYRVSHTMEGENHILMFRAVGKKGPDVKVKYTLVQLGKKAEPDADGVRGECGQRESPAGIGS